MDIDGGSNIRISKNPKYLKIIYSNPNNHKDTLDVYFNLNDNPVVDLWIKKLQEAKNLYKIDHPDRFYGFGDLQEQKEKAYSSLIDCINIINSHNKIITREIKFLPNQDDLNYLHNIFEVYHGLLDCQTHPFYLSANVQVRTALADLNIIVHRFESISRGAKPRHVITYFGLPKNQTLCLDHYKWFTDFFKFGTIYLNYVEIGKTIEDLALDNDQYISDTAFKPFRLYSADFFVCYYDSQINEVMHKRKLIKEFYDRNQDFFSSFNYNLDHPYLRPGRIPLATIQSHGTEILDLLKSKQHVKEIELID
jgi:hypothetical protein